MKTQLTTEQSLHLLKLGVSREKASRILYIKLTDICGNPIDDEYKSNFTWKYEGNKPFMPFTDTTKYISYDIFKLIDFLDILPKEIKYEECLSEFTIQWNNTIQCYDVGYTYYGGFWKECRFSHVELIDALYELACWYYGEFLNKTMKNENRTDD